MIKRTLRLALVAVACLLFVLPGRAQQTTQPAPKKQQPARHTTSPKRVSPARPASSAQIIPGADRLYLYLDLLKGHSVAVFANQTSVVGHSHLVDTLLKCGVHITKIFSPEHGFRGDADAGSKVSSTADPRTGIPIISLYGAKNRPSAADLADVDIMLFDIQDVGVRFYTYISSLQKYIESAAGNNRPLILLDRPNPNGSYVDGPVLDKKFSSFVGMQPVPVVYGMTMAEYAMMLIGERWLDTSSISSGKRPDRHNIFVLDGPAPWNKNWQVLRSKFPLFQLIVIPCDNYTHNSPYTLPVPPSPNLPNQQSVYLYPSICFFEGTAISLGRGTDRPFQQFGSPYFPSDLYHFTPASLPGARNPPLLNVKCYGYDLSQVDVDAETGGRLSLKWLLQAYRLFPNKDSFFLANKYIDKLAGTDQLRQQIREGMTEEKIRASWQPGLTRFQAIRKKYLIYP